MYCMKKRIKNRFIVVSIFLLLFVIFFIQIGEGISDEKQTNLDSISFDYSNNMISSRDTDGKVMINIVDKSEDSLINNFEDLTADGYIIQFKKKSVIEKKA